MQEDISKVPEKREQSNLKIIDPAGILITEHNLHKRGNKELYGDTFDSIRAAIEAGKADEIPPIVALQNPFDSIDKATEAYKKFTEEVPRQGGEQFENEDEVLREILEQNVLLCYNGNRRLEEFQKAKIPIKAFVITSQEEYEQMPAQERRIPDSLKAERPTQYQVDQDYVQSYLQLLDDVVYVHAKRKHFDNFDAKGFLAERRKRNLQS